MGQSLTNLGNSIVASLFGRRLGIDSQEYLVGPKGMRQPITDLTSASTADALLPYGTNNIYSTTLATSAAGGAFLLPNPAPGVDVTIQNLPAANGALASTAVWLLRPSTAFVINSSEGSTMTSINLTAGSAITLQGASTDRYAVKSRTTLAGTVINGTT